MKALAVVFLIAKSLMTPEPDVETLKQKLSDSTGEKRVDLLFQLSELLSSDSVEDSIKYSEEALTLLDVNENRELEIKVRNGLSKALSKLGKTEQALEHAEKARKQAMELEDNSAIALSEYHVALAQWYRCKIDEALAAAQHANELQSSNGDTKAQASTLTLLGAIHRSRSSYDESLRYHLQALELSQQLKDESGIARARNNIGLIYWSLDKPEKAKDYLLAPMRTYRKLNCRSKLASTLSNLGLIHNELNQPQKALEFLKESLELQDSLAPRIKARTLSNVGFAYEKLKDNKTALNYYMQALKLRREIKDRWGLSRTLGTIGHLHAKAGKHDLAIEHYEEALENAKTCEALSEQSEIYSMMAASHKAMGRHKTAFELLRRHYQIKEQMNDSATSRRISEIEASATLAKKQKQVEALKRKQVQQALLLSQNRSRQWIFTSIFLCGLIGVAALFVFWQSRTLRAKRKSFNELQTALHQLSESELRYRSVFEDPIVPKFLIDNDAKKVIDSNEPAGKLCHSDPEALRDSELSGLSPDWLAETLIEMGTDHSCRIVKWEESGKPKHAEFRATPLDLDNHSCIVVTVQDVTEERRMEEERIRLDKLESLGLFAGGIAHDFNNTLAAVLGYVSVARHKTNEGSEIDVLLERAENASEQAECLTSQLLAFAKGGQPQKSLHDAEKLVAEAVSLGVSGSKLQIEFEVDDDLNAIDVDAGQIRQVISNIVINAVQAMDNGGQLKVTASNVCLSRNLVSNLKPGDYVLIKIKDSGPGIPAEHQDKIMDPYFTTKTRGSGLGLSTAFSIVMQHNGWMEFKSEEGQGTTFSLYLPSTIHHASRPSTENADPVQLEGSGSILVMDDDPEVQEVFRSALCELGYASEIVDEGNVALSRWCEARDSGNPFDLVIMDLTVPGGMGGDAAMEKLLNRDPDAVGVVASGYHKHPVLANYRDAGFAAALEKPFTIKRLGMVLNQLLQTTNH